jgi:sulfur-oxidizing protein SoxB
LDSGKLLEAGRTYRVAGWASVNPQGGKPAADVLAAYLRDAQNALPKKLNKVALKGVANNPGIATMSNEGEIR